MCGLSFCEVFSLLILTIASTLWALVWTQHLAPNYFTEIKKIKDHTRYIYIGVVEFIFLLIIIGIFVRYRRRRRMEKSFRERASKIMHTQSDYGSIEGGQSQLYYIQERLFEMDKDEIKRFRDSLISRTNVQLYPELNDGNKRSSLSTLSGAQHKVKVKVVKSSCTTRSPMLMKLLIVGNPGTGKSTLLKRWIFGQYSELYRPTLGADFVAANLELQSDGAKLPSLSLQAWDIAGQERFASMTGLYYNKAVCFCVVYDISSSITLQGALWWINDIQSKVENPYIVVLANKLDLKDYQKIIPDDLATLESAGDLEFYEVSAKTGENVNEVFRTIIVNSLLMQIQQQIDPTKLE